MIRYALIQYDSVSFNKLLFFKKREQLKKLKLLNFVYIVSLLKLFVITLLKRFVGSILFN
jgi:hypothetical protein